MDYRIKELLTKIEKDISRPVILADLAKYINVSVSYLQHLFKKEVGFCIVKYINNLRLEKSRELLETTHLQVKQIRLRVGLTHAAHFTRKFKRRFGNSPNGYRKVFRNSGNGLKIAGTDNK